MKVCMVAYTFYEADNRVRRYAESLVRRGDQVDVISLSRSQTLGADVINGVRIFRIQKRLTNEKRKLDYFYRTSRFLVKSFWFLTRLHLKVRYDLIHVHSVPDYEVFAAIIPKLFGAKVLLDIHDIVPEFYAGKFNGGESSPIYKILLAVEKMCCAFSDHVIISNDLWWGKITGRSITKSKCTTILNYPDPHIFHRRNVTKKVGEPFTFIYPGTLNWHQGLDIAVKAFVLVKKQNAHVAFHIYGRGQEEGNLIALTKALGLSDSVLFKGTLPLEEVAVKMEAANAGVVPKRASGFGNEAFSTKIFEFMALGVPAIVSKTKIDQHYFNETQVLFFEPDNEQDLAEKMLLCMQDHPRRESLIKNAEVYIGNQSWEVKKDIYFNLIDSLYTKP